jgi:hypothetical protein
MYKHPPPPGGGGGKSQGARSGEWGGNEWGTITNLFFSQKGGVLLTVQKVQRESRSDTDSISAEDIRQCFPQWQRRWGALHPVTVARGEGTINGTKV